MLAKVATEVYGGGPLEDNATLAFYHNRTVLIGNLVRGALAAGNRLA